MLVRSKATRVLSVAMALCLGLSTGIASDLRVLRFSTVQEADHLVEPSLKVLAVAYRNLNIRIEATPFPLARSLIQANSGAFDGELGRSQFVEQSSPNLRRVPTAIGSLDYVPYVVNSIGDSAATWAALKESKLKVGARLGDMLTQEKLGDSVASKVPTFESLFQMLALKRVDVVIAPQGELQRQMPLLPMDVQKKLRDAISLPPLSTVPIYHFLHVKNVELIAPLDRELQKISKDGTIKKLWSQTQ